MTLTVDQDFISFCASKLFHTLTSWNLISLNTNAWSLINYCVLITCTFWQTLISWEQVSFPTNTFLLSWVIDLVCSTADQNTLSQGIFNESTETQAWPSWVKITVGSALIEAQWSNLDVSLIANALGTVPIWRRRASDQLASSINSGIPWVTGTSCTVINLVYSTRDYFDAYTVDPRISINTNTSSSVKVFIWSTIDDSGTNSIDPGVPWNTDAWRAIEKFVDSTGIRSDTNSTDVSGVTWNALAGRSIIIFIGWTVDNSCTDTIDSWISSDTWTDTTIEELIHWASRVSTNSSDSDESTDTYTLDSIENLIGSTVDNPANSVDSGVSTFAETSASTPCFVDWASVHTLTVWIKFLKSTQETLIQSEDSAQCRTSAW